MYDEAEAASAFLEERAAAHEQDESAPTETGDSAGSSTNETSSDSRQDESGGGSEDAPRYYGASIGESNPYDSSSSYDPSADTSLYKSGESGGGDAPSGSGGYGLFDAASDAYNYVSSTLSSWFTPQPPEEGDPEYAYGNRTADLLAKHIENTDPGDDPMQTAIETILHDAWDTYKGSGNGDESAGGESEE